MAILEKEVWITLHSKTSKHFEELGYEIPRYIDKQNKKTIKRGTKIKVKVEDLPKGSNVKVTKICDICGKHIPNQQYKVILETREDNKDRCYNCGKIKGGITKKNNIKYEQSLEYFTKENNMKYLLEEFSEKNLKKPNEIPPSTSDIYIWKCNKCQEEYSASLNNRKKGSGCPYCSNRKVLKGYNDLWTTHPKVASMLKNKERGYELTSGVAKKEKFICNNCGFEQTKSISNVVTRGLICSKCSDGISYPEKFMINVLDQLNVVFETQKIFNWSDSKRYDFYIPEINCIIETHGMQHYEERFREFKESRTLKEEMENDEYKMNLALKNEIDNYIVLDCRDSTLKYLKNSIMNSALKEIHDFNNIDWMKCHEYACDTLVKDVCELWNSGVENAKEIGKKLKLAKNTVINYLEQGKLLKWCAYDPKEEMRKNGHIASDRNKKKVVQLTLDGDFIKEWESISNAKNELNIKTANISGACKGIYKTSGGFKWMYLDDYNKLIKQ